MEYNSEEPYVSIVCTAYNHEKYIRKCLEGFLMQKTSFKFEVLVHDDASTDRTADIIREYEKKQPDIIKPVYQEVNQYSLGKLITGDILVPLAKGRYIAYCEGDDYWVDPLKLQKQVDALEKNPTCKMAVHRVAAVTEDESKTLEYYPSFSMQECVMTPDIFFNPERAGYSFQTSSYMFDAESLRQYFKENPLFRRNSPVGDECYLLYFGNLADVYYSPSIMSHYRRGNPGSWSSRASNNYQKKIDYENRIIGVFQEFDQYSYQKYHRYCLVRIWKHLYAKAIMTDQAENYRALLREEYQNVFHSRSVRMKMSVLAGAYLLPVLKLYRRLKDR